MKIIRFSVKHSLFVNLLSLFLVVAGIVSLFQLNREAFPNVSYDVVTVTTSYRGASAEEVERLVTAKLEKELREVDDIEEIYSSSGEGFSQIVLEISPDATDNRKVTSDIQKAVDRVTDLPREVDDRPVVTEIVSGKIAVIKVALSGNLDEFTLRDIAEKMQDRFEDITGVASVSKSGWRDEEYWVEPDLEAMLEYHVSLEEIMDSLNQRNVAIPGGKLRDGRQEFVVKVMGEFSGKEEIENVVIRANDLGNWLRVKDVASVKHTFEDERELTRVLGSRSLTLDVIKRNKGDAIEIVENVKDIIEEFRENGPEELEISTLWDLSYYINRRLRVLRFNGTIGLIFVVAILFIFLRPIPAITTALGIPIAMLTTLYMMNLLGMSINLISMFGLITVLGMIVDDGIIISENTHRYLEQGMSPREAAIKGAGEVAAPVLATVLTTVSAFSPLLFMSGILGKFIRPISVVVIIALAASVIEAFVILPSHLADFCKPLAGKSGNGRGAEKQMRWFKSLRSFYRRLIGWALDHRYLVSGGLVMAFIGAVLLAVFVVPFILFPSHGVEQFEIRAEAEVGTSLERMAELMVPVEEFVDKLPDEHLDTYQAIVGAIRQEGDIDPEARSGSNLGMINVYLTPAQERRETAQDIIEGMRPGLEQLKESMPELTRLYFKEYETGPPVGKAVDVRVRGEDFGVITEVTAKIRDYLSGLEGVYDVGDSYDLASRELRIAVDEEKAAKAYLTVGQVARAVHNALEGGVATTIKRSKAEEEIKVMVRLPKEQRDTRQVFDELFIRNSRDNLVPLREIARIEEQKTMRTINHLDGKRFVSVFGSVDNKKMTSSKAGGLLQKEFKDVIRDYPGYNLIFAGEQEETAKSMRSLLIAFGIAVLLIFIILATQFNSLMQPAVVLLTIPFGMIGVILAFWLHGRPFSFLAILGIIGLTGVVVNDSIVLVDFINKLRQKGVSRRDSIIEAGTLRLRPVLITTFTTVAGLSTVAYGIGGSDPFLKPMALAISWGLLFATALTLVIMPCFYAIIDDVVQKLFKHATVKVKEPEAGI